MEGCAAPLATRLWPSSSRVRDNAYQCCTVDGTSFRLGVVYKCMSFRPSWSENSQATQLSFSTRFYPIHPYSAFISTSALS
ncbi:hypothetical protein IF1G_04379 [Cordyceps javanica]|uniref:Uncharacterized protein n=1 Tax=Cordyceps javanica TaxID=43265 RepID=A0A545V5Z9_9HYPO|nr:hypothetical protein IF1G_04379 [Cordyceps javanica]